MDTFWAEVDPDDGTRFAYEQAGDVPVVGDWNRDGVVTVGVRRGGTLSAASAADLRMLVSTLRRSWSTRLRPRFPTLLGGCAVVYAFRLSLNRRGAWSCW
ncbi:MAG: hypothetical protein ACRDWG_16125 [Actinomycetes bacterium]